jgi:hypothetical protein
MISKHDRRGLLRTAKRRVRRATVRLATHRLLGEPAEAAEAEFWSAMAVLQRREHAERERGGWWFLAYGTVTP